MLLILVVRRFALAIVRFTDPHPVTPEIAALITKRAAHGLSHVETARLRILEAA